MNEVFIMHKKDVLTAIRHVLNVMVKHDYKSSDLSVCNVSKLSSGRRPITGFIAGGTGSDYGSPKAIAYVNCASSQDTVTLSLNKSRIIGYGNRLQKNIIIKISSMLSMMQHTFTRMGALSIS